MKTNYRNGFGIRHTTINLEFQAGTDIADAIHYVCALAKTGRTRVTFTFNEVSFDTASEPTEREMWAVWNSVMNQRGNA